MITMIELELCGFKSHDSSLFRVRRKTAASTQLRQQLRGPVNVPRAISTVLLIKNAPRLN